MDPFRIFLGLGIYILATQLAAYKLLQLHLSDVAAEIEKLKAEMINCKNEGKTFYPSIFFGEPVEDSETEFDS